MKVFILTAIITMLAMGIAKAEWKHQCVYKDGAYTCCYSTDDGKNWYCN